MSRRGWINPEKERAATEAMFTASLLSTKSRNRPGRTEMFLKLFVGMRCRAVFRSIRDRFLSALPGRKSGSPAVIMAGMTPEMVASIKAEIEREYGGKQVYLRKSDFVSDREIHDHALLRIALFGWRVRLALSVRRLPPPGRSRSAGRIARLLRRGILWAKSKVSRLVRGSLPDSGLLLRCSDL